MNNAERIKKLTDKLAKAEENKTHWDSVYNEITQEIMTILGAEVTTATRTAMAKPTTTTTNKPKQGELSERIVVALGNNPGQDLQSLTKGLKGTTPAKVGVALYHLQKKGLVEKRSNEYFPTTNILAAAAKSVPTDDAELESDVE